MFAVRHQLDIGIRSQHATTADPHPVLFEVPVQGIGGEIVLVKRLHARAQLGDGGLRLANYRTAGRHDQVRLLAFQFGQALDEFRQPRTIAVVAANLGLGDRILKAVQIQQLAIPVDQVSGERQPLAVEFCQVTDRAPRKARRFQHAKLQPLPLDAVALVDPASDFDPGGENLGRLLGVVVIAGLREGVPIVAWLGQQELLALGGYGRCLLAQGLGLGDQVAAAVGQQQLRDIDLVVALPTVNGQAFAAALDQHAIDRPGGKLALGRELLGRIQQRAECKQHGRGDRASHGFLWYRRHPGGGAGGRTKHGRNVQLVCLGQSSLSRRAIATECLYPF